LKLVIGLLVCVAVFVGCVFLLAPERAKNDRCRAVGGTPFVNGKCYVEVPEGMLK
jgi:hypothetical protein